MSVAIASLFGAHAQQFQSISAQASAFHGQFVRSLTSSAGAYLGAEVANVQQVAASVQSTAGFIAGAPVGFKSLAAPTLLRGGTANTAGPYEQLFANTSANLQALRAVIAANPAPLLHQFLANQQAYAQRVVAAIQNAIENFPASVSTAIQTFIERLAAFDPVAFAQWVINNQIGYAHTIGAALSNAAHDFTVGLQALPAAFESAIQDLLAGNIGGAVSTLGNAFVNLFFTGFSTQTTGPITDLVATVTPTGTLGDLLPILTIPGEMAQNFTSLWPVGSIAAQMSQNFTNVIDTVTDTSIVANAGIAIRIFPPAVGLFVNANYGMPVALLVDAAGAPVNALHAADVSATAFSSALEAGNFAGAANALVDAPAVIANGFLNGQMTSADFLRRGRLPGHHQPPPGRAARPSHAVHRFGHGDDWINSLHNHGHRRRDAPQRPGARAHDVCATATREGDRCLSACLAAADRPVAVAGPRGMDLQTTA